ncbi:uncharacterized protein LOC119404067 [Rhipicephalus sanguineus]|uniref:uncharacterized protein LOC119404067 n=1 Tax=Rhipicephalus sanguineus TaxID=34632 RepID=UPI001894F72B|nr:uncharacterized protein LOC119404067 [Rhipicephalus sanguineus]
MEMRPQMEVFQPLKTLVTSLSFCSVVVTAFFLGGLNQANVRFCMLSQASSLQSQCILCNQQKYNTALNGCLKQNSLPANISQEEAFCIIAACIDSPRQTPITLGKRKRREDPDEDDNVVDEQVAHLVMEDYELVDDGDRSL